MYSAKDLSEQRAKLAAQARAILDKADGEKRSLTAEEENNWNAIQTDVDGLKSKFDRIAKQEAIEAELATVHNEKRIGRADQPFEKSEKASLPAELKEQAFRHYVRNGMQAMPAHLSNAMEYRALGEASGSIGGYTVPQGFYSKIVTKLKSYSGVRNAPITALTTETGNDLPVPIGDDTGNVGQRISENSAVPSTGSDPVFSQGMLHAYTYTSNIVLVPMQLLQDNAIDLDAWLSDQMGIRIARAQGPDFTTGTGSSQPQGLVYSTAAYNSGSQLVNGTVSYDSLTDLEHTVDPAYRAERDNCAFGMSDVTLKAVKKLKDSTGRPLWEPGLSASFATAAPDTILGYRYYVNQFMDAAGSGGGYQVEKSVIFGNHKYFFVRDVQGGSFLRLTERYADYLQVGFMYWMRSTSLNTNPSAFSILQTV